MGDIGAIGGVGMRKGEEGMEGEEWRREGGTEGRREVRR